MQKNTFALGVTGGIGSGKSEVCRILASLGARVFYADLEARRIMTDHAEVRTELIEAFGPQAYLNDGTLNRAYIAEQVFGNDERVAEINQIVHPRVRDAFLLARQKAQDDGIGLFVHEAALIYESGADKRLDAVAVVHAPAATRIARVVSRDETTPAKVAARMEHQLSEEERLSRADFVIDNTGTLAELRQKVHALYTQLTQ